MNIKIDSRKVREGDIFVALPTLNHDGHDYIEDAIQNGASMIVAQKGKYSIPTLLVEDTREFLATYLHDHYYEKIKNLKLIGLTGTNGKTTTCYCIYQALNKLGHKCAYIGTIGFYRDEFVRELPNTTPELLDLYEMLLECVEHEVEYVVMEVSSHALSTKRVSGLTFDTAIFTNLTEDHLDFHKTMEEYANAKETLFHQAKMAMINIDDSYHDRYLLKENDNRTYGKGESDYQIFDVVLKDDGSRFKILHDGNSTPYETKLLGLHNIYNLTSVIAFLNELKIEDSIKQALIKLVEAPKGRMETFFYGTNRIIVDYAHTPDAEEKIIEAVKSFAQGHIYILIGCGGDRDPIKRPIMAKIATEKCDYAIFTSDNPRTEDPMKILHDMTDSLEKENYEIIENREKAILRGIQMCEKNDILLVLGKGHENYQIIGTEKKHFDDAEVVIKNIRR